ncbi:phenylalanine--tRNA ligase subunit alpha [Candidatus Bathyarchaeota archaeon]|nr:phenylalanine--tRNA ligase subunit alpha [Candidatus Bathyarchaeota archaeon]
MASTLHEHERRILQALRERGSTSVEELQRLTGLSRGAVEKASAWAETKGVVEIEEEAYEVLRLTDEGRRYLEEGLPEKRLIKAVSEGVEEIEALRRRVKPLEIALAWARRKGWINIERGRVTLTEEGLRALGEKTPDEGLLEQAVEGLRVEKLKPEEVERAEQLRRRGLLKAERHVRRTIRITELGREVLPHLGEVAERVITQLTPELLKSRAWRGARFQRYDVKLPAPRVYPGKKHFIRQVIDYIRRFWVELGFREMKGPIVELAFWNFDALFQPQDHPARDLADTFYMKTPHSGRLPDPELVRRVRETHENGWTTGSTGWRYRWDPDFAARCCLRTHTTSLSARTLALLREEDLPAKFFSIGKVFRNEAIDWSHLMEFYQTDGIVVGEGVTFRNLLGYLKAYLEGLGVEEYRFRPSYFPYTEMSVEAEVWVEERGAWMELFGAGIFRPEVVKPLLGRDIPVLAWGPGFDRIVMGHYGIRDLRVLYGNDIGLLRRARLWVR